MSDKHTLLEWAIIALMKLGDYRLVRYHGCKSLRPGSGYWFRKKDR